MRQKDETLYWKIDEWMMNRKMNKKRINKFTKYKTKKKKWNHFNIALTLLLHKMFSKNHRISPWKTSLFNTFKHFQDRARLRSREFYRSFLSVSICACIIVLIYFCTNRLISKIKMHYHGKTIPHLVCFWHIKQYLINLFMSNMY